MSVVSVPLSASSPLSTPVACHRCHGFGISLFGPCVVCRAAEGWPDFTYRQSTHIGEARDDYIIGDDAYIGEVLHVARDYMWIRPLGPLPSEVATELSEAAEGGRKLYVAMADVEEDRMVLFVGTKVVFKVYKDHTGVGGCNVTSP